MATPREGRAWPVIRTVLPDADQRRWPAAPSLPARVCHAIPFLASITVV